ncbi:hypothetical protein BVRB_6g137800 [Beta vulgaris subsp. vulgaris]|nr:hypothetical protein BVRB_6g137800 [Beta vulgaris subsp. vulgaris]
MLRKDQQAEVPLQTHSCVYLLLPLSVGSGLLEQKPWKWGYVAAASGGDAAAAKEEEEGRAC